MIVNTWNGYAVNDGTTYITFVDSPEYGNAPVEGNTVGRHGLYPLVGGVTYPESAIVLTTYLEVNTPAARAAMRTIFETESGTVKTLIVTGDEGEEQYIQAICEAHVEVDHEPVIFQTVLRVHDDPAWRATEIQTQTESVTANEEVWIITNNGDQIARPILTITPTSLPSGANAYRRFVAVRWRGDAATRYPVDIMNDAWDTAALVTAVKMQADGDDIRVLVNGLFASFWLDDINTNNTSVWLNLDWQAAIDLTLAVAIAATGTVETIEVNEEITALPSSGILLIDDELFLYTSKNDALRQFSILARAAHGTAMAAHIVTDVVYWIQHAIEVQYGSATLPAYTPDSRDEPIFALATSSNTVWDYDNFGGYGVGIGGNVNVTRPGSWLHTGQYYYTDSGTWTYTWYNESQFPLAPGGEPDTTNPWQVMGLYAHTYSNISPQTQRWYRHCPCGITAANFQNGFKRANDGEANWRGRLRSSVQNIVWITEFSIPVPSVGATWQSWSQNETTIGLSAKFIGLDLDYIRVLDGGEQWYLEAGDVTLTFDTSLTPNSYIAPERDNYTMDATITHLESGRALRIVYSIGLNDSLVINTHTREVIDQSDGSSQFQAVRRLPSPRVEWLPLEPGINTFEWTEVNVIGVDVTFDWQERRGA